MSRARVVSAAAFGLAAAVVAGLTLVLGVVGGPWWMTPAFLAPFAAIGAALGALAGPSLRRCRTVWAVVGIGLGVTVVAALLSVGLVAVVVATTDLVTDEVLNRLGADDLGWLAALTVVAGVVVSPVGMLASWLAWDRIRAGEA
ncbi:hypothetical protein [Rubrivirga sp.]|uniref:hypothetical protein n=1 Tax=Rubrivirga sp. TaxID=1885344 RepID=UPI003B516E26